MPFEELHFAFVLFGRRARSERSQVAAFTGLRVHSAGVEPVFTGFESSDHIVEGAFEAPLEGFVLHVTRPCGRSEARKYFAS